jgi:DHA2 family multidrug resistance protein
LHHAQLIERLSAGDPATTQALGALHASGAGNAQSLELLNRLVDNQAYVLSADDIFYASALIFLGLIFLVWFAHPVRGAGGSAAPSGAH